MADEPGAGTLLKRWTQTGSGRYMGTTGFTMYPSGYSPVTNRVQARQSHQGADRGTSKGAPKGNTGGGTSPTGDQQSDLGTRLQQVYRDTSPGDPSDPFASMTGQGTTTQRDLPRVVLQPNTAPTSRDRARSQSRNDRAHSTSGATQGGYRRKDDPNLRTDAP